MQFHFSKVFQQFVSAFSMRILRPQQGKGGGEMKKKMVASMKAMMLALINERTESDDILLKVNSRLV